MLVSLYFVTSSLNPEAQSLVMVEAEKNQERALLVTIDFILFSLCHGDV